MATCTIEHPVVCTGGDAEGYTPAGRALCGPCLDSFWDRREATQADYPDSDIAPSWFDPTYAGERWDADY